MRALSSHAVPALPCDTCQYMLVFSTQGNSAHTFLPSKVIAFLCQGVPLHGSASVSL